MLPTAFFKLLKDENKLFSVVHFAIVFREL